MPPSDYSPSVDAVGALLRARTKNTDGEELGTFTADTRPKLQEVQALIDQSAGYLSLLIGDDVASAIWPEVSALAALKTAMQIELSYYPEQVASDRSAYAQYKVLWDEAIGTPEDPGWLLLAVRRSSDDGDVTIDQPGRPRWNFPNVTPLRW